MAIANALKTNKSLEILSLVSNPISRCVFTNEVAPMLKINTTLKELSVGDHILSIYEVAGVLLEALKSYNDTVYICMHADKGCVATDVIHELAAISVENRSGTRRRKNIFNRLREMWILGSS